MGRGGSSLCRELIFEDFSSCLASLHITHEHPEKCQMKSWAFTRIKLDWVCWASEVGLRVLDTYSRECCALDFPHSIPLDPQGLPNPWPSSHLSMWLSTYSGCASNSVASAGYLGVPAPNFLKNLIPWLPLMVPLLKCIFDLTLSWACSLVSAVRGRLLS